MVIWTEGTGFSDLTAPRRKEENTHPGGSHRSLSQVFGTKTYGWNVLNKEQDISNLTVLHKGSCPRLSFLLLEVGYVHIARWCLLPQTTPPRGKQVIPFIWWLHTYTY